jgi:hypothetical protein
MDTSMKAASLPECTWLLQRVVLKSESVVLFRAPVALDMKVVLLAVRHVLAAHTTFAIMLSLEVTGCVPVPADILRFRSHPDIKQPEWQRPVPPLSRRPIARHMYCRMFRKWAPRRRR